MSFPSSLKANVEIFEFLDSNDFVSDQFSKFHNLITPSLSPEARVLPSKLNAIELTRLLCP